MIDRRVAVLRTLRNYHERVAGKGTLELRYDNANERRLVGSFWHHRRMVSVEMIAPSEDQNDTFRGQLLPQGQMNSHIDDAPGPSGPITQGTWDAIIAAAEWPAPTIPAGENEDKDLLRELINTRPDVALDIVSAQHDAAEEDLTAMAGNPPPDDLVEQPADVRGKSLADRFHRPEPGRGSGWAF